MSGIEIVGIALGSIPLIISALEHFEDGKSTVQRWRRYERERQSLLRNLRTEKARFQNICEKLLDGVAPPSLIESMIINPLGKDWKSDKMRSKLEHRLWKDHDIFEAYVKDIEASSREMMERIQHQSGGVISKEFRRVRFAFSRARFEGPMNTLRDSISKIESLINQNIELEPPRRVRTQAKFYVLLRGVSFQLHGALKSNLCHDGHSVSLRFESWQREFGPKQDIESIGCRLSFNLGVSHLSKASGMAAEQNLLWKGFSAKPVQVKETSSALVIASVQTSGPGHIDTQRRSPIRSSFATSSQSSTLVETTNPTPPLAIELRNIPATQRISNICSALERAYRRDHPHMFGCIADKQSPQGRGYELRTLTQRERSTWTACSTITLEDVLAGKESFYVPLDQRLKIAVVVASSFLQLLKTPWFPETLRTKDVLFLVQQGNADRGYPMLDRPIVLEGSKDDDQSPPEDILMANLFPLEKRGLVSLGIVLTELILGDTMDALRGSAAHGGAVERMWQNHLSARELIDQGKMPSSFCASAIKRCFGSLFREGVDMDGVDFCHDFHTGVVALLEKDLQNAL